MRGLVRFAPLVFLGLGVALLVAAVMQGSATLSLVVIVPVLTGDSWLFFAGTLLLVIGIFGSLSLAFPDGVEELDVRRGASGAPPRSGTRGVLLIGPLPVFFGDHGPTTRGGWWAWVAVGTVLTLALTIGVAVVLYGR